MDQAVRNLRSSRARPTTCVKLLCLEQLENRIVPGFIAGVNYETDREPDSLAVADLNGDGKLDIVAANYNAGEHGTVSVLLGNGDGTFRTEGPLDTGGVGTRSVAVGDINNDGKLDIVVANEGDNFGVGSGVAVLLGNGDGTFRPPLVTNVDNRPTALALGDFDHDGSLDIAVAQYTFPGLVTILWGDGSGFFPRRSPISLGNNFGGFTSIVAGELKGDANLDLAVTSPITQNIGLLFGDGKGSFAPAETESIGSLPYSLAIGDFTKSGHADIVTANDQTRDVSLLEGKGDGSFHFVGRYSTEEQSRAVAVGDFNQDGNLDVVTADIEGITTVLLGNGDGTFGKPQHYNFGLNAADVAVGDFTNTGSLDLAVANVGDSISRGFVTIFKGNGDGTFQIAPTFPAGPRPSSLAVGVFTDSGLPDVVTTDSLSDSISVLINDPLNPGTFALGPTYKTALPNPRSIVVGDFSGDGILDLAVAEYGDFPFGGGAVEVFLGDGTGSFHSSFTFASPGRFFYSLVAGDFNNDGTLDLALLMDRVDTRLHHGILILKGNGDGTFQEGESYETSFINPTSLAVGDLNGNGMIDIAVSDFVEMEGDNSVKVLFGKGNGTFKPPVAYRAGLYATGIALGSLRGDGRLDIVVANGTYPGTVSVLLNDGHGSFGRSNSFLSGANGASIVMGDFNSDGHLDLAVANLSNSVSVLLGNGDGSVGNRTNYFAGGSFTRYLATVHYGGATWADHLMVANYGSDNISYLQNDCNWSSEGKRIPPAKADLGAQRARIAGRKWLMADTLNELVRQLAESKPVMAPIISYAPRIGGSAIKRLNEGERSSGDWTPVLKDIRDYRDVLFQHRWARKRDEPDLNAFVDW